MTLESAMDLSNYFGIEYKITTENLDTAIVAINDKIKSLSTKIKKFIKKALLWIKSKFLTFLKIDSIEINPEMYRNATEILSKIEKVGQISESSDIKSFCMSFQISSQFNFTSVNMTVVKMIDNLSEIEDSDEYKHLNASDNSKPIRVKTSTFAKKRQEFGKSLQRMNEIQNKLNQVQQTKEIMLYSNVTRLNIKRITMQIYVINAIINNGKYYNRTPVHNTQTASVAS